MKRIYPDCLYSEVGCKGPCECLHCGFDRKEAERRKSIPLTRSEDGTMHKVVRSYHKPESDQPDNSDPLPQPENKKLKKG